MKKISKFIAVCIMMFTFAAASSSAMTLQYDNIVTEYTGSIYDLVINDENITDLPMPPIIFNDRALVPLREVFEAMGARVDYNSDEKGISVNYGDVNLKLKIGSPTALLNDNEVTIPDGVTPKLIAKQGESAKTMVPVRFISETIGMTVDFDGDNGVISITSPEESPLPEKTPVSEETPLPAESPKPSDGSLPVSDKLSSLGSIEAYVDGEDTVIDISSSDGFGSFTTEKLTDPTRIIINAQGVAARSAMVSCEINKGSVKFLRIAYENKSSKIVLDTETDIGDFEVTVNDKIMSVRIKPYIPPEIPQILLPVEQTPPAAMVSGDKIIVIDAGHGGSDPGASGTLGGVVYEEKNINLSVALKVADILRNNGCNVQMTRTGDTYPTLEERSALANSLNAALFVSIHSNSYEQSSANGTEVYYSEQNNGSAYGITSSRVAEYVLSSMMAQMDTRNRGVKTANHVVTRTSNMPAILIELGFLTNESDMSKLCDDGYQNAIAQGIADGIIQSLSFIR
ncbi:MAG: N-acetylmuramoyl-L-alanine amidase [Oscillospiraceae bacterium]|nr:N-acetylmuramoyl-L-alanine amidase [Oscillospiraceae bacterium]